MTGPVRGLAIALLLAGALGPAALPAQAQPAAADATVSQAPWRHAGCTDPAATGGLPTGGCRHMRVLLEVEVPETLRQLRNVPVSTVLDLAASLRAAGHPASANGQLLGFTLDAGSFVLVEVEEGGWTPLRRDADGSPVSEGLLVAQGGGPAPFDARTNPVVTLQWVLAGTSAQERHYFLYFDSLHHGAKPPAEIPPDQAAVVATSVGPGRGTTLYVPLHGDLGFQSAQDPRVLRITNLQARPVTVDLHRYSRFGTPEAQPWKNDLAIPAGAGQTVEVALDPADRVGALKVEATGGPVAVEASSRLASATYRAGSFRLFLPSADGGYVGTAFAGSSPAPMDWLVFCPKVAANAVPCQATFSGTPSEATITPGGFARLAAAPGVPHSLRATVGLVAVERVPSGTQHREQLGLTPWPAMDGPSMSLFNGDSGSDKADRRDKLVLATHTPASRLEVRSLVGQRATLADGLAVGGPGIFTEAVGGAWGTIWGRPWRLADSEVRPEHEDGPARIADQVQAGLTVFNGYVRGDDEFSALVPLQSPNGGLTYHVAIPKDFSDRPLGKVVLFAPYAGTSVRADGANGAFLSRSALLRDQFVDDFIESAGSWEITATRPVLAFWTKLGVDPMAGLAGGITQGPAVRPVAAQFAGHAFALAGEDGFKPVQPGTLASFRVQVANAARTVDGTPLQDAVRLVARAPAGWPVPEVAPSTAALAAGGMANVTVSVRVPTGVDLSQGGATLLLDGTSASDPAYKVQVPLRIKFQVARGVDLTADGLDSVSEQLVAAGEDATYVVRVTNRGTVPDSFRLAHTLPTPRWRLEATCPTPACFQGGALVTPTMASGASLDYFVAVRALSADAGRLVATFVATSESDPTVTDAVRLSTAIDADRDLAVLVDDPARVVVPGNTTVFRVTIHNNGTRDEEVRILVNQTAPAGWPRAVALLELPGVADPVPLEAVNATVGVPLQSSVQLTLLQKVPEGVPPNLLTLLRLAVESRLGAADSSEHELRVVSGQSFGIVAEMPSGSVPIVPGGTADVPVRLRSLSNANLTVQVDAGVFPVVGEWATSLGGEPGPWKVELAAGGTADLTIRVSASQRAPASSVQASRLIVRVAAPGAPTLPADVSLQVPDQRVLAVLDDHVVVEAGLLQPVAIRVRNDGNVPLSLAAAFQDLPWTAHWQPAQVRPGDNATLVATLDVPASAMGRTARLAVTDQATGTALASSDVRLQVVSGDIGIALAREQPLADGLGAYSFEVTNHALEPARAVLVELLADGAVVDAASIETILPGSTHVANLVGPRSEALELHLRSADDPEGRTWPVPQTELQAAGRGTIPALPAAAALGLLAALAALRRRPA